MTRNAQPFPQTLTHDRDVLQQDVELPRPCQQILPDLCRDDLSLGDQLGSIELGNGGFEDFVTDRGKDSFVVAIRPCRDEIR